MERKLDHERLREARLIRRAVKWHRGKLVRLGFAAWRLVSLQRALAGSPNFIDRAAAALTSDIQSALTPAAAPSSSSNAPRSREALLEIASGLRVNRRRRSSNKVQGVQANSSSVSGGSSSASNASESVSASSAASWSPLGAREREQIRDLASRLGMACRTPDRPRAAEQLMKVGERVMRTNLSGEFREPSPVHSALHGSNSSSVDRLSPRKERHCQSGSAIENAAGYAPSAAPSVNFDGPRDSASIATGWSPTASMLVLDTMREAKMILQGWQPPPGWHTGEIRPTRLPQAAAAQEEAAASDRKSAHGSSQHSSPPV